MQGNPRFDCLCRVPGPSLLYIHTHLGTGVQKAHRKEAKVGNSGNLIYYQHENEDLLKVLGLSVYSEKITMSI